MEMRHMNKLIDKKDRVNPHWLMGLKKKNARMISNAAAYSNDVVR